MKKINRITTVAVFLLLAALAARGAAKRGITPEDYLAFQFIGDPHISPDGNNVAYVLTTIDAEKESSRIVDLAGASGWINRAAQAERGRI